MKEFLIDNFSGLARVVRSPQGVGEGRRGGQVRRRPEEGQGRPDQLAGLHEPSRLHRVRKGHQQSGLEICSNRICSKICSFLLCSKIC